MKMVNNFFPSKKAQGMSLNIIIVAVILIAILVIILIMVGSKTNIFGKSIASCESKGGGAHCIASVELGETPDCDGIVHKLGTDCGKRAEEGEAEGPWCCVPVGG